MPPLEDYVRLDMVKAVFKAAENNQFKTPAQMSVLLAIVTSMNVALECIASYEQLANWTSQSERAVRAQVKALCEGEWLTYSKGNTGYSNVYQVQTKKLRDYAHYYLPKTQSEVCKYKGYQRTNKHESLAYNTKARPYVLREDEDMSILEDGTYFTKPNDLSVYLMRDVGGCMVATDIKALSDYDRAYSSRREQLFDSLTREPLIMPEDVPY